MEIVSQYTLVYRDRQGLKGLRHLVTIHGVYRDQEGVRQLGAVSQHRL